ncbi:hypothetical protein [Salinivibrio socompensis]|uniref:hypothetical protein n=1 Tax=Salinivibrio socompensis TaxID=1510206 RepID=UPI00047073B2
MSPLQQRHFDALYQQHLNNLTLQANAPLPLMLMPVPFGVSPHSSILPPDNLSQQQLKTYFVRLIASHS